MSQDYFTDEHEWIRVEGEIATIGITDHAQQALGDIVFVELPDLGRSVKKGEATAVVESVKAASDVYSPVSGAIVEANQAIAESPALVNQEAESGGWFFKIRLAATGELDGLMDRAAYDRFLAASA